jgi:multiple sugar transport system ATP-binding protein
MNLLPRLADGPLTVGLRPETVSVRAVGQGPVGRELAGGELAGGELAAEVVMVEALGADTMLHLRCGDVLLAARQPAASLYAAGERLALSWPPDALHLFDGRDGQRLN